MGLICSFPLLSDNLNSGVEFQRLKMQVLTQQELQNANTDVPQISVLLLNTCYTDFMISFALMIQLFSCNHKQYG